MVKKINRVPATETPVKHRCDTQPALRETKYSFVLLLMYFLISIQFLSAQQTTYYYPINLDYGYTSIPNFSEWGKHRATADPIIVNYKGNHYLFSKNQWAIGAAPDKLLIVSWYTIQMNTSSKE